MKTLYDLTHSGNNMEMINYLQNVNILHKTRKCPKTGCQKQMKLIERNDSIDGYAWRCSTCRTRRGIRVELMKVFL